MTDDATFAEALALFRHERTLGIGETADDIARRIDDRVAAEHSHLRDLVVELGTGELSDQEVRRRLWREADGILVRKAAYAEWRKEYRAKFWPAASTGAPAGP